MGIGDAWNWVKEKWPDDPAGTPGISGDGNPLDILSGDSGLGPEKASTANLTAAMNRAFGTQDKLANERAAFGGNFDPRHQRGLMHQQDANIQSLADIAAGRVPSPVELQLRQQAARNAAGSFGAAAGLQGRNPGAALRMALDNSFRTNSAANLDAAAVRAAEQQRAQQALTQAIFGARGQDQNLLGADIDWRKALLSGELNALGAGGEAAGAQFKGENTNAAAQNQFNAQGASILGSIFSDERVKTDVKPADLDTLADSLKGFRFRYKDAKHGAGERVGVMAQDVAKGGPAGKRMVNMGGDGKLRLDVGNAVGAALAMSAKALRESKQLVRGL